MAKETLHIYTRVSTQTQQDEGTSLESQKELGIQKAKELGFDSKVWNEGGASSHYEDLKNRPVLLSLLSVIDTGQVKHLWVFNNDRLSRNDITAQTIRMALQKHGVTLYTQNGKFDLNNPQDKFMKTIFDGLAQFDNTLRTERTRLGKVNRVKQGYWMGGPPPFGYTIKNKKLERHPAESKWVEKIFNWYNSGKTIKWIKSNLDKSGVETRRNKGLWTLGSIQKILQNTHPTGNYYFIDSKTNETVKCSCPPIISTTLWNACQEKRKQTLVRRGQNNRTKRFYLLRNLLYCGHCGSAMSGRIKEDKKEYLYYCPHKEREWVKSDVKNKKDKWKRGTGCSMTRSLNIPATDSLIATHILIKNTFNKYKNIMAREAKRLPPKDVQITQLQNKQKLLTKQLEQTIQDIADVETAKIQGKKDARVVQKIIDNLNSVLRNTEIEIEQTKLKILDLEQPSAWVQNSRGLERKVNWVEFDRSPNILSDMTQEELENARNRLTSVIRRIDVTYDKGKNEHKLIVRLKVPLFEENDITFRLKKNKRTA